MWSYLFNSWPGSMKWAALHREFDGVRREFGGKMGTKIAVANVEAMVLKQLDESAKAKCSSAATEVALPIHNTWPRSWSACSFKTEERCRA